MSVSFFGYVNVDRYYSLPADTSKRIESTLGCPPDMDVIEWINSDIEEQPNPLYDPRIDVNLSNDNAIEILNLLGLEMHATPMPIEQFINIVAHHRRKRLGKMSAAIPPTVVDGANDNPVVAVLASMTGRRAGYIEDNLKRLSDLAQAFKEYGATTIGWG